MTAPATRATLAVAVDELERLTGAVRPLDAGDWARATTCGDWTVADLAAHVAEIAWRQAEAFHRYRLTTTDPPGPATVAADVEALPRRLDVAAAHLRAAIEADLDETPNVPLPFAPLPASIAGQVLAIEYGVHRYDIERALHGHGHLRPEVADFILGQLPVFLLIIGTDAPDGTAYRLRSDTVDVGLARVGGQWQLEDPPATRSCAIEASDETLALFVMGRVASDDPSVDASSADLATQFKQLFPGP